MHRRAFLGVLLAGACKNHDAPLRGLSDVPPPARPRALHGPYRVRARPPGAAGPINVPAFPAPVHDQIGVSYYSDARSSEIDPKRKAQNEQAEAPLRELGRALMLLSDGYLRSGAADSLVAAKTVDGLFAWASADALLGQVNRGGLYQSKWALGAYALDYLKVRDDAALDPKRKLRVEAWFRRLAARVMSYAGEHADWPDHANNHAYWAGMAVAAAGIACNDGALFDWGVAQYGLFLQQLRPDGTLPLEMARGKRALHYHLFALAPLVMLAELAEVNGIHLYAASGNAIDHLVKRSLAGVADPHQFGLAAGAEQVVPEASDLAWLEIYQARFPSPTTSGWLTRRPFVSGFLGGDLTLAFGGEA
jgi:poly(beta-D-mannuronate) lyase